ncbi:hypothetical protein ACE1SV_57230 [Streptomyces sennicomposti]
MSPSVPRRRADLQDGDARSGGDARHRLGRRVRQVGQRYPPLFLGPAAHRRDAHARGSGGGRRGGHTSVANGATHALLRSFGPVPNPGGRLLVVARNPGTLGRLDPRPHPLSDGAVLERAECAVESRHSAVHSGTAREAGWPLWVNVPSKAAHVVAVRAVASNAASATSLPHPGRRRLSRQGRHPRLPALVR